MKTGLCLLLGGCVQIGPSSIKGTRLDYNIAVQRTTDEQLLVNLVRLRYRDNPFFLDVSAIASQLNISSGASAGANLVSGSGDNYSLGGSVVYSESPTISYAPLQGDDFVKRLLSPVSLDELILLAHSGWSISRILRVCVQRVNGIENAPRASGPTPDTPPAYADFLQLANDFRALQLMNALDTGYREEGDKSPPVLHLAPVSPNLPVAGEIRSVLGLTQDRETYVLTQDSLSPNPDTIRISTRSLLGMLFYLSQSVNVPVADEQAGKVTVTRNTDGSKFDWNEVTHNLFQVRSSETQPQDAAVAVHYRGTWFFIDDADLESKSTFALLSQLFSLQAGSADTIRPVLTLPVGR